MSARGREPDAQISRFACRVVGSGNTRSVPPRNALSISSTVTPCLRHFSRFPSSQLNPSTASIIRSEYRLYVQLSTRQIVRVCLRPQGHLLANRCSSVVFSRTHRLAMGGLWRSALPFRSVNLTIVFLAVCAERFSPDPLLPSANGGCREAKFGSHSACRVPQCRSSVLGRRVHYQSGAGENPKYESDSAIPRPKISPSRAGSPFSPCIRGKLRCVPSIFPQCPMNPHQPNCYSTHNPSVFRHLLRDSRPARQFDPIGHRRTIQQAKNGKRGYTSTPGVPERGAPRLFKKNIRVKYSLVHRYTPRSDE